MKPPSGILKEYYDTIKRERTEYLNFIGDDIELHDYKLWCEYKGRDIKDPFNDNKNLSGFNDIRWDLDKFLEEDYIRYGFICSVLNKFDDIDRIISNLGQYHYMSEILILRKEDLRGQSN
ncbi:hypothetical protein EB001_07845 [bacterium]|jgi:hypothetical protein|nr:hypothetical protein [bacterium]